MNLRCTYFLFLGCWGGGSKAPVLRNTGGHTSASYIALEGGGGAFLNGPLIRIWGHLYEKSVKWVCKAFKIMNNLSMLRYKLNLVSIFLVKLL